MHMDKKPDTIDLLDRGLGAAGVIGAAPAKSILFLPFSTLKISVPVLINPANIHRAVPLTPEQFHYSHEHSERRGIASGVQRLRFAQTTCCSRTRLRTLIRTHASTVNFHNNNRAPLLLIVAENDHVSPPAAVKATGKLYGKSTAVTEYKEFRSHYIIGQDGWQEVADFALDWSANHALAGTQARKSA
jgi:hypothetical protein